MAELSGDARRTYLANERTQLAWWRTGLTSLAVALGVGRVVPQLNKTPTKWPYVVVGAGFAIYGVAMIAYGACGARSIMRSPTGQVHHRPDRHPARATVAGIVLAP